MQLARTLQLATLSLSVEPLVWGCSVSLREGYEGAAVVSAMAAGCGCVCEGRYVCMSLSRVWSRAHVWRRGWKKLLELTGRDLDNRGRKTLGCFWGLKSRDWIGLKRW